MMRAITWWCVVLVVLFAGAAWVTRPLIFGMWDSVYPHQDALYTVWALNHNYQTMASGNWAEYWRAPMLTPYRYSLVLADAHLGTALWTLPAYLLTGSTVFGHNVAILGSFVGTGIGCYLLASLVTKRCWLALMLAVAGMAIPFRLAQLVHLQLLMTQWLPIALWCLLRCAAKPRKVYVVGFAVSSFLTLASSLYYGVIQFLLLAPVWLTLALRLRWYRTDRLLGAWCWTVLAILPLVIWFLLPYFLVYSLEGFEHRLADIIPGSARPVHLLNLSNHHWFTWFPGFGAGDIEFALFPGFVFAAGLMMSLGVVARRRNWWSNSRSAVLRSWRWTQAHRELTVGIGGAALILLWWLWLAPVANVVIDLKHDFIRIGWRAVSGTLLLLTLFAGCVAAIPTLWRAGWLQLRGLVFWSWLGLAIFLLLSLGPLIQCGDSTLAVGPYVVLYRFMPGFQGMRVPARVCLLFLPLLVMLAGSALDHLLETGRDHRSRWVLPLVASLLLVADLAVKPVPWDRVPLERDIPEVFQWLARDKRPGGVLVLPLDHLRRQPSPTYLYYAIYHRRPLLNGFPVFTPSECDAALKRAAEFPDADVVRELRDRGIRFVVLDKQELLELIDRQAIEALVAACDNRTSAIRRTPVATQERFVLYEILPSERSTH